MLRRVGVAGGGLCIVLAASFVLSCSNPFSPGERVTSPSLGGSVATAALAAEALEEARRHEGDPYRWAADGPDAFDCSGLIVWSYQQAAGSNRIFRGRTSWNDDITMDGLYEHGTEPVDLGQLRPGDILFITSSDDTITHGGIFIGWASDSEVELINDSSYYDAVVVDQWPVSGAKRGQWVAGGGRLMLPAD